MNNNLEINPGTTYRLRCGYKARVYATDGGGLLPIHGAYRDDCSYDWHPMNWAKDGRRYIYQEITAFDIVEEWK